jgi:hypothetical protein
MASRVVGTLGGSGRAVTPDWVFAVVVAAPVAQLV